MNALVKYIKERNAKTQIWIDEDPKNRFGGKLVEDPKHWEDYKVYTPKDLDRYLDETTAFEVCANAYSKSYARSIHYGKMSDKELTDFINDCDVVAEANAKEEQKEIENRITEFKELVDKTIKLGAKDEKQALKWLSQNDNRISYQDYEYWVWEKGFLYSDYGKEIVDKLKSIYMN